MKRVWVLFSILALTVSLTGQQKPADQKWDVAADIGPTTKMDIETSEGTWMNSSDRVRPPASSGH